MPSYFDFLRKQPQQSRSRHVVTSIVEAAADLLERVGAPEDLSVEAVARRAGVGIGSLYDYFSNRESLLGALLARLTDENFAKLEAKVGASSKDSLDAMLPLMVDATFDLYLESPKRTRAVVLTVFRLGWVEPVVKERDRFAKLLARRIHTAHPDRAEADVVRVAEVACDAIMGVIVSELWRTRTPEESTRIRQEVVALVRARLAAFQAE